MQSQIALITIFVAVHVNYISSEIRECKNDLDVLGNLNVLKTGIVPILLLENENPLNPKEITRVTGFYNSKEVNNILFVPANKCAVTKNLLKLDTNHFYPSIFLIKNGRLVPRQFKNHLSSLNSSYNYAELWTPRSDAGLPFVVQLRTKINDLIKMQEMGANVQPMQPAIPMSTHTIRQTTAQQGYPRAILDQTIASTHSINTTNQLPTVNTRLFGRIIQPYQPTDLPQTSVSFRTTGEEQPATWLRAPVSYLPSSAWANATGNSSDVQTTPKTLSLFGNEPARPQPKPIETQHLLRSIENSKSGGQIYEDNSNPTRNQYQNYIQFIPEESSRKRFKHNGSFSGSRQ